ncbi:hypothetical protein BU17DRAFT_75396 [Hysterangium stoloniferum]|nr:hypothetical protein BU17DRAFT_75396 [Hysterangium stoloniferum]
MTSLPDKLPARLQKSATIKGAYPMVLEMEATAKSTPLGKRGDDSERKKRLVFARVVGYLLLEGPSDQARKTVALEVVSANNVEDRFQIGQMYFNHYIRCFRRYKGRTPTPSEHPSRPSFDALKQVIQHELREALQNHSAAKRFALIRDGYRCMITHTYDYNSTKEDEEAMQLVSQSTEVVGNTECAHIFPSSTNANISNIRGYGDKQEYAATIWTIMERFGYVNLFKELNNANIHCLENIMTLEPIFHNCHNHLPLPSPVYLEIHAACAAEYIDKYEREMEDIKVLSKDGASADILYYALQPLSSDVSVF